jgi:hypothetical protein
MIRAELLIRAPIRVALTRGIRPRWTPKKPTRKSGALPNVALSRPPVSGAETVGQFLGRGADQAGKRDDSRNGEKELNGERPLEPTTDQCRRDEDYENGEHAVFAGESHCDKSRF